MDASAISTVWSDRIVASIAATETLRTQLFFYCKLDSDTNCNNTTASVIASKTWAVVARENADAAHRVACDESAAATCAKGAVAGAVAHETQCLKNAAVAWSTAEKWARDAVDADATWAKESKAVEAGKVWEAAEGRHPVNKSWNPEESGDLSPVGEGLAAKEDQMAARIARDLASSRKQMALAAHTKASDDVEKCIAYWVANPANPNAKVSAEAGMKRIVLATAELGEAEDALAAATETLAAAANAYAKFATEID
jgi:hypothetical protein